MKKIAVLLAASGLCAWSQSLDLSSLDKFAAKAKEANTVTLTRDQLQAAAHMVPADDKDTKDGVKKVMSGLESVQVRNFEFDEAGQFSDHDLDSIRAQVGKMKGCTSIVESRDKKEHSQVFLCTEEGKTTGLIVINSEPKELNVVYVKGSLNLSDLGKFDGMMGIPRMGVGPVPPVPFVSPAPSTPPPPARNQKPGSRNDDE